MLDDFFVVHESAHLLVPQLTEEIFALVYIVLTGSFLLRFHIHIFKSPFLLLLFAFAAFGVSTLMDTLYHYGVESIEAFIEDSLKFAGICFWRRTLFQRPI